MIPVIKTARVAYNIGFSSSLSEDSVDGHKDASRWRFISRRVYNGFLKGWICGYQLRKEVGRENLLSRQSVQASDSSGDGTVENENTIGLSRVDN